VILSRLFLKEKLTREQYLCITMVILGIVALGVAEGLAEG
jgi:multidrug transporter EmrE-like cation transporter